MFEIVQARHFKLAAESVVLAFATVIAFAADAAPPNTLTVNEQKGGWKLLFEGKPLAGWRGYQMNKMLSGW